MSPHTQITDGRQERPIIIEHGRTILGGTLHCPMWQALQHYRPLPQLQPRLRDAHRDDGKRYVVHSDEKLTAFLETEKVTRDALTACNAHNHAGRDAVGERLFNPSEQTRNPKLEAIPNV